MDQRITSIIAGGGSIVFVPRGVYTMRAGDTIATVADKMGIPNSVLSAWNRGSNFRTGDKIIALGSTGLRAGQ